MYRYHICACLADMIHINKDIYILVCVRMVVVSLVERIHIFFALSFAYLTKYNILSVGEHGSMPICECVCLCCMKLYFILETH